MVEEAVEEVEEVIVVEVEVEPIVFDFDDLIQQFVSQPYLDPAPQ